MNADTTIKHQGGLMAIGENEIVIASKKYLKAYDAYISQKTIVNRNAMFDAWKELKRIKKQYRDGEKLMFAFVCKQQRRS